MKMSYGSHQHCRLRDSPDGVLKENVLMAATMVAATMVAATMVAATMVAATMVAATMVIYIPEYHFGTSDTSNDLQTILSN
jgi:pseudouridine-5'-phosphate glycosidase